MKNLKLFPMLAIVAMMFFVTLPNVSYAQDIEHGNNFVDEDGDGYNDNAPDADGDGIPNGQDEDYVPAGNGGYGGGGFVDEDGDGFNDNAPDTDGDGIPNGQDEDYVPAGDGSGGVGRFVDEERNKKRRKQ